MLHYTCKRILGALPVFFGITLFVFFLINMAPATIADAAGGGEASSAAVRAALEANLGLDKPLPLRYVLWLKALLQGDLGLSYRTGQPVVTMIAQRVVPSLILTGTGVAAAILLGIPLGVMAAWKPKSGWGKLAGGLTLLSFSAPGFFLCVLAIFLFSVVLGWLPAAGMYSAGGGGSVGDLLLHLILPAGVVCLSSLGNLVRQTASACGEVLGEGGRLEAWIPDGSAAGGDDDPQPHPPYHRRLPHRRAHLRLAGDGEPAFYLRVQPGLYGHYGPYRRDRFDGAGDRHPDGPCLSPG